MKGTLSISWGPYGGFYLHPHRVCLGFVAITWLPNIEIDDLMDAYAKRREQREASGVGYLTLMDSPPPDGSTVV